VRFVTGSRTPRRSPRRTPRLAAPCWCRHQGRCCMWEIWTEMGRFGSRETPQCTGGRHDAVTRTCRHKSNKYPGCLLHAVSSDSGASGVLSKPACIRLQHLEPPTPECADIQSIGTENVYHCWASSLCIVPFRPPRFCGCTRCEYSHCNWYRSCSRWAHVRCGTVQLVMSRGTDAHRVTTAHLRGTPQRHTSAAHGTEENRKMVSNNRWDSCYQNRSDCIKK